MIHHLLALAVAVITAVDTRPNVVLVMTDDQGYGDFGFAGQPVLQTPHLDALAAASARVEPFYVSPVCAPTRACLMTGRYNYRTRAIDTYIGRAMMEPAEVTLAERLRDAGYATGLFGKWHLGDCYPMRPQDQGFDEVLMHRGGGIGQPSDPPGGEGRYTDPILFRNGVGARFEGYCTDVYVDHAIAFMRRSHEQGRPFFCYLPTNAPHGPFHDVPAELHEKYAALVDDDKLARIFAMIENVDANVGRVVAALDAMDARDDTLVIFMIDNGPQTNRYVCGMRGRKGGVHEGGIRSPFLASWPGRLEPGRVVERVAAHIDVMPTILEACGVAAPEPGTIDGRSLWPLLEGREVAWPERHLVIQAHRGDRPVPMHHFMIRDDRWKLLRASGFHREQPPPETPFELYDLRADPRETKNLAETHPDVVRSMLDAYMTWWTDVGGTRPDNYAPPRIVIGSPHENPTVLTRQDWRRIGGTGDWNPHALGEWHVDVAAEAPFDVLLRFARQDRPVRLELQVGDVQRERDVDAGVTECTFENVTLPAGPAMLRTRLRLDDSVIGALQVEVRRRD